MTQIMLPDPIAERLQRVAIKQSINLADLLVQAVEYYLSSEASEAEPEEDWDAEQRAAIHREMESFTRQHKQLLVTYRGQTIAMLNGKVIDHDVDEVALSQRVRNQYGNISVLITPVLPQLLQTITVRSPRIQLNPIS